MSVKTEKELYDYISWFCYHKDTEMDIDNKIAFLSKAIEGLVYSLAPLLEDLQRLEGRRKLGVITPFDPYLHKTPNSMKKQ